MNCTIIVTATFKTSASTPVTTHLGADDGSGFTYGPQGVDILTTDNQYTLQWEFAHTSGNNSVIVGLGEINAASSNIVLSQLRYQVESII